MLFKRRSVLDERLKSLEKELGKVSHDIRSASKGKTGGKRKLSLPRQSRNNLDVSGPSLVGAVRPKRSDPAQTGKGDAGDGRPIEGDRFANYFTAGHFQNLRPLRQERRIVRNKAILMVVIVLLIILWLLYYWRGWH